MKICFVALNLYPVLDNDADERSIGGAELQQAIIARALRRKGHEISVITLDYGSKQKEFVDGVRIIKTFKPKDGYPVIRFFFPRLLRIWHALAEARAEVYYTRAAGFLPAIIAAYTRIFGGKLVYAGAHDTDFMRGNELIRLSRDRLLYRAGLRAAHAIIVQNRQQLMLLTRHYNRSGFLVPNFSDQAAKSLPAENQKYILWVSTIREFKRPTMYVELAQALPQFQFIMIGGKDPHQSALFEKLVAKTKPLPNLSFLGYQPLATTESYFDGACLFVNTSRYEGFPNTYLQAWRRGVPVVTFCDPDDVVQSACLGRVVTTEDELKTAVEHLLIGKDQLDSNVIRDYFRRHHSSSVVDRIEGIFRDLTDK